MNQPKTIVMRLQYLGASISMVGLTEALSYPVTTTIQIAV